MENFSGEQLYIIAVTVHLKKITKPDYDYKIFDSDEEWINSLSASTVSVQ